MQILMMHISLMHVSIMQDFMMHVSIMQDLLMHVSLYLRCMYVWCTNACILNASPDQLGAYIWWKHVWCIYLLNTWMDAWCMILDPDTCLYAWCIYPWCGRNFVMNGRTNKGILGVGGKICTIEKYFWAVLSSLPVDNYKLTNMKDNFKMLWHFPKPKIKTFMSQYKKEMWKSAVSLDPMLFNWLEWNGLFTSRDGHAHAETKIIIKMVKNGPHFVCVFLLYMRQHAHVMRIWKIWHMAILR